MEIEISRMNVLKNSEKQKAFFDIIIDGKIEIKGFKIVDGNNGRFISMPREKSLKDGKWYNIVNIPNEELLLKIDIKAQNCYNERLKNENSN